MLIRLLCAHEMTKHVCNISRLNSKRLLRKLQKILGGYFILPHPVHLDNPTDTLTSQFLSVLSSFNLTQHDFPTHDKNHILDLVITSSTGLLQTTFPSSPNCQQHSTASSKLSLVPPFSLNRHWLFSLWSAVVSSHNQSPYISRISLDSLQYYSLHFTWQACSSNHQIHNSQI